jgi:hypothetical protein
MPRVINCREEIPPDDAVRVDRGTKWGNPFRIGLDGNRDTVIRRYEKMMIENRRLDEIRSELKGKDLVCWCKPEPCHGDFLLLIANSSSEAVRRILRDTYPRLV